MPIAHCVINPSLTAGDVDVIQLWSQRAEVEADLLTINFIESRAQLGAGYGVMVTLQLPSLWSRQQAAKIQLALASALATYFAVAIQEVHVVTQWVESGDVVENGEEVTW